MQAALFVGLGGFFGSVLRFTLGRVLIATEYPLITMLINFLGALAIGFISELASQKLLHTNAVLFLRTGLCGGFTTFSTFSLETFILFQSKKYLSAISYSVLSVGLCLVGVFIGAAFCRLIKTKLIAE